MSQDTLSPEQAERKARIAAKIDLLETAAVAAVDIEAMSLIERTDMVGRLKRAILSFKAVTPRYSDAQRAAGLGERRRAG
jgi:hypothetical protein